MMICGTFDENIIVYEHRLVDHSILPVIQIHTISGLLKVHPRDKLLLCSYHILEYFLSCSYSIAGDVSVLIYIA